MVKFNFPHRNSWVKTIACGGVTLLLCLLSGGLNESRGDVPETQKHEVAHLLDFVSQSGCLMKRNGSQHTAQEAVKHIQKKYDYYRDRIKTTEDFIDRAASHSSLSGKSYKILCPGEKPRITSAWLKEELRRFRKQQTGS